MLVAGGGDCSHGSQTNSRKHLRYSALPRGEGGAVTNLRVTENQFGRRSACLGIFLNDGDQQSDTYQLPRQKNRLEADMDGVHAKTGRR